MKFIGSTLNKNEIEITPSEGKDAVSLALKNVKLTASYDDGSSKEYKIRWDAGEVEALANEKNGRLQLHGQVVFPEYDKVLVEEYIRGKEIEVAVMGNRSPVASLCGEIDSGVEFYDYDAKYITDTSTAYVPARISEDAAERVREMAIRVYQAVGCQGLSRVDFFVTEEEKVVFNEINTIPGFTSISMYPKLFAASGIPYPQLIDELIGLAMEEEK